MTTIKHLAVQCNVSEQAIRKWCSRNHVAKDGAQHYIIDETTESLILQYYNVKNDGLDGNQIAKHDDTDETIRELVGMLKRELEQKDKQINDLTEQLTKTTVALMAAQESVKAAQALQANAEKKLIEQEQKPEPEEPEPPEKKKHWWWR